MSEEFCGQTARRESQLEESRFSEQQIVAVLKEAEAGAKTADLCRKHGVSSATFYARR